MGRHRTNTGSCAATGCDRSARVKDLCQGHYARSRAGRPVDGPLAARGKPGTRKRRCEVCERQFIAKMTEQRTCSRVCGVALRRQNGWSHRSGPKIQGRTRVPAEHPARWIGACSPVRYAECLWCGRDMVQRRESHLYCSEYCTARMHKARRKSRERGTPEHLTWTWGAFMRMAAKFSWCCAYCGNKPDRLDPDHVVPLSRGGANTLTNLLPTCLPCNSDKRDLLLDEWALDRARRGLPERATSWAYTDSRYLHLTSQVAA